MNSTLTIFADTNIFIQCKSLDQLDWSLINHTGNIDIVVTMPVLTELDKFKSNNNTRRASKAKSILSILRNILSSNKHYVVIKECPLIRLKAISNILPEQSKADILDYKNSKDDRIIGIALAYQNKNPEESVCIYSNDNGILFTAREVGLNFSPPPETWLLPPELDNKSKDIKRLREELKQYANKEPKFEIQIKGFTGKRIKITHNVYKALTTEEIDRFLKKILTRYPETTDFGPTEPHEKSIPEPFSFSLFEGELKEFYTPVPKAQIIEYKDSYKNWLESFKDYLKIAHQDLNYYLANPVVTVLITNTGSRPAIDALVEIISEGNFELIRNEKHENDEERKKALGYPSIPNPPVPPEGVYETKRVNSPFSNIQGLFKDIQSAQSNFSHFNRITDMHNLMGNNFTPNTKDPNDFYWKDIPVETPVDKLSLTCEQWRHAREAESFNSGLRIPQKEGIYNGCISVCINAANLTKPTKAKYPIEINVKEISPIDELDRMVSLIFY